MKLNSVSEIGFTINSGVLDEEINGNNLMLGFSNSIEPDIERDKISLVFGVRYDLKENIVLESKYKFVFSVVNLADFIKSNEDNSITVNKIIPHLLSVAVGTMRGILVVRTAGTKLSQFPLPMIDVNNLNKMLSENSR